MEIKVDNVTFDEDETIIVAGSLNLFIKSIEEMKRQQNYVDKETLEVYEKCKAMMTELEHVFL